MNDIKLIIQFFIDYPIMILWLWIFLPIQDYIGVSILERQYKWRMLHDKIYFYTDLERGLK